jgi:hypothetical protein
MFRNLASATSDPTIAFQKRHQTYVFDLGLIFQRELQGSRPFAFDISFLFGRCIDDRPDRMGVFAELDLVLIQASESRYTLLNFVSSFPVGIELQYRFQVLIEVCFSVAWPKDLFLDLSHCFDLTLCFLVSRHYLTPIILA